MGERAQLLGRWAAHQALMRAWNTCVSKSGAASLQFGRQVPAGHWKTSFPTCSGTLLTFPLWLPVASDFWGPNSYVPCRWGLFWLWVSACFWKIVEEIPSSFPCELTDWWRAAFHSPVSSPARPGDHIRELPMARCAARERPPPGRTPQWDEEQSPG